MGQGRTPSLQRHFVTKGKKWSTPASGSSEATEMPESTKRSPPRHFKKQDLLCKMNKGGGSRTSKRSSKPSSTSLPNATSVSPEPGSSRQKPPCALTALERLKVLVPGKEAVMRTPGHWVTEPAGWGSSRSLMTGPHCYCFCGEPWSRTPRAMRATPAPGRWDR